MSVEIVPQNYFTTGGVGNVAMAIVRSRVIEGDYLEQCMYCLDATSYIPSGSTVSVELNGKASKPEPRFNYRA